MPDLHILQMPIFKKVYKKLPSKTKDMVDTTIREIIKDPKIGTKKKGDLSDIYVYKFKIHKQEILLAYTWHVRQIILLALGTHENFYRDL